MPEPTRVRRQPDATTAHRRTARLLVLDAITADVEAGLVQLSLSTDDPEDTEPCREALRMRLCRLRDAASTLRLSR